MTKCEFLDKLHIPFSTSKVARETGVPPSYFKDNEAMLKFRPPDIST